MPMRRRRVWARRSPSAPVATRIWAASALRRDSSYPRRLSSTGSPKGATLRTVTSVPGVSPISTSRRFTGPFRIAYLENNTALARRHLLQGSLVLFRLSPHSRSTQKI